MNVFMAQTNPMAQRIVICDAGQVISQGIDFRRLCVHFRGMRFITPLFLVAVLALASGLHLVSFAYFKTWDIDKAAARLTLYRSTLEAELRAQEDGDPDHTFRYVEFSVTDNGPGMTEDVKRRALDPFFSTKSTNSGTGLGLSMVYGFVQQSGGELRIYSELNSGTTMRILLPRGNDDNEREEPVLRETPVFGDGQTVLLVEDELHLRTAMEDLVSALGYEVVSASSGQNALQLIDDDLEFDLLLTDIVMPGGISGFELAAEVRSRHSNVAVLYMSGYAAYSDREMGVVIAPLLQKPCSQRALSEHLRDALA